LHVGPPGAAAVATGAATTAASTADQATAADTGAAPSPTAAPADPYPVPEAVRDVAFVLLVIGSLALAAWGAGSGPSK
jgi:hypothetical protein